MQKLVCFDVHTHRWALCFSLPSLPLKSGKKSRPKKKERKKCGRVTTEKWNCPLFGEILWLTFLIIAFIDTATVCAGLYIVVYVCAHSLSHCRQIFTFLCQLWAFFSPMHKYVNLFVKVCAQFNLVHSYATAGGVRFAVVRVESGKQVLKHFLVLSVWILTNEIKGLADEMLKC